MGKEEAVSLPYPFLILLKNWPKLINLANQNKN